MIRTWRCLLALILVGGAGWAHAQEPIESELDFVRKLRARGSIELAKAYLDVMLKRNDPALASILPLEQARTLLAAAREKEAEQRFGLFTQARDFLKDYTAKNAGKPAAAQGTLELARLSNYEGQALLTKALRELDPGVQQDLAKPAEAKFLAAADELQAAIKLLEKLADDPNTTESVKTQLKQDLIQARFERGANYIDQARTYVNTSKEDLNFKRAQIVQEAKKVFDALKDEGSGFDVRSQANAWLMKIAMESQDPGEIEKFYNRTMGYKSPDARIGQRWARLFDMQDAAVNAKNPRAHPPAVGKTKQVQTKYDVLHHIQKLGLNWLKDYPAHVKSPEGEGVLWELANSYYLEAKEAEAEKKIKHKPPPEVLYQTAQKYYGMLAQGEGDYSEKANQVSLSISFQLMGKRKDFRTFEEFFLKGQFELLELRKLDGSRAAAQAKGDAKQADTFDNQWKQKLGEIRQTFSRALAAANERTPIQKLDEARYMLTSAFLLSGDLYRAAVAGEALGRTRPPTRRAPSGAGYAIDAYAALLQKQYTDDTKERLKDLIEFVLAADNQKFWATEPVTAVAHYQLAMLANRDGDTKRAIAELEQLPKEFPGYTYAQGQLVFIALRAKKENTNLTDNEKKQLTDKLRAAILRMPPLAAEADPSTAFMYYLAQLELSKLQYSDAYLQLQTQPEKALAGFLGMRDFLKGLGERYAKSRPKLSDRSRDAIDYELATMQKYANLGQAEADYRKDKFDEVLKVTQPVVEAIKKLDTGKGPLKLKDYQVTGDILGLALRAEVRKGNIATAKDLLEVIKRLTDEGEASEGANDVGDRVTRNLIAEIRQQVKELENKPAELKKVVGSFRTFLDEMMKGRDLRKLPMDERMVLAKAFSGLGMHEKAADLYDQIPTPKALGLKLPYDKLGADDQKALREYWTLKLEQVNELRDAKDYAGALKILDGTAQAPGLLRHPQGLYAMPYGYIAKNLILEADKKYGAAVKGWTTFMQAVQKKVDDNNMKKLYFDGYFYRTRTIYLWGLYDPAIKDRQKIVDVAAKLIVDLERAKSRDGWEFTSERFMKLLTEQPQLKEAYDRLKK